MEEFEQKVKKEKQHSEAELTQLSDKKDFMIYKLDEELRHLKGDHVKEIKKKEKEVKNLQKRIKVKEK